MITITGVSTDADGEGKIDGEEQPQRHTLTHI